MATFPAISRNARAKKYAVCRARWPRPDSRLNLQRRCRASPSLDIRHRLHLFIFSDIYRCISIALSRRQNDFTYISGSDVAAMRRRARYFTRQDFGRHGRCDGLGR